MLRDFALAPSDYHDDHQRYFFAGDNQLLVLRHRYRIAMLRGAVARSSTGDKLCSYGVVDGGRCECRRRRR